MSFLGTLENITKNVGRGALDIFTLGANEAGHKWGGDWYRKLMNPVETGFGANFEAGATGGSAMLGAQGLGMFGGAGGAGGAAGMSAPSMGGAGVGATPGSLLNLGMGDFGGGSVGGSPLTAGVNGVTDALGGTNMAGYGSSSPTSGSSSIQTLLKLMRSLPQGGGQQQAGQPQQQASSKQDMIRNLYEMFPNLRPGFENGSQRLGNLGGSQWRV